MTGELLAAIRTWLTAQGVSQPIYIQHRPPTGPDACVLLRDYGDAPAPPFLLNGRLQVVCRGAKGDVKAAKDLAEIIHDLLWPASSETPALELTAGGRDWLIGLEHLSGPLDLGQDESGRFDFSINYRLYSIRT